MLDVFEGCVHYVFVHYHQLQVTSVVTYCLEM